MQTKPVVIPDESQEVAALRPCTVSTNVVAGAGTGKTSVLVARYMKLVEEDGLALDRILALTFTLKAAAEMRDRIRTEVARRLPDRVGQLSGAWILNFHQFGHRFIRENAPALGVDPGVDVISPAEFQRVMAWLRARFEAGRIEGLPLDFGGEPPAPTDLPSIFDTLMKIVHKCRDNMIEPRRLRELCREADSPAYIARVDAVVALAAEWEAELCRRNLIGFSEMISIPARALVRDAALAERYRNAFDHILVDEFQDTSRAQNEMLRALAGDDFNKVTVVGDVKQAIYRWRDARPENVTEFPAERKELLVNYRSRANILELAHELVAHEPALDGFAPRLEAHRGAGTHPILFFHPPGEEYSHELEARALADWVEHLMHRNAAPGEWELAPVEPRLEPSEIAVLLRGFKRSRARRALEEEFSRRSIPYALVGGAASAEATALEAWHELLSLLLPGPRVVHLLAVLEARPFAVSEASLHQLIEGAPKRATTHELLAAERLQRITDARDAATVKSLCDQIERLEVALHRLGFREFLAWAVEHSPLRLDLAHAGVSSTAADDVVRELHDIADTLSRHGVLSLAAYLDQLDATLDEKKFREEGDVRLPDDRVAIMTIHQAKGLEFRAVAVAGVGPPPQGSSEHFVISPQTGLYLSKATAEAWGRDKEKAPEFQVEKAQEMLEERCIMYVALTRAKDYLWVSSPYADGISRGRTHRESLFTELVSLSREHGLAREVRVCSLPREHAQAPAAVIPDDETESALRSWIELRSVADAYDLESRFEPGALHTVTWASLARYAACPLAFRFDRDHHAARREDTMGEDAVEDAPALELPKGIDPADFGAFVHAVLEKRQDMGDDLDYTIGRVAARYDFGKHASALIDVARARINGACAAGLAGASEGARSELPFAVRVGNVLVHGVIDRLDTLKDGALVTDYKLGALHESHHFQVAAYAWAAGRAIGVQSVRARLVYLGFDPIRVDDVETDPARIGALVDAMAEAFESGEFEATPGKICVTCEHRSHCAFAASN